MYTASILPLLEINQRWAGPEDIDQNNHYLGHTDTMWIGGQSKTQKHKYFIAVQPFRITSRFVDRHCCLLPRNKHKISVGLGYAVSEQ